MVLSQTSGDAYTQLGAIGGQEAPFPLLTLHTLPGAPCAGTHWCVSEYDALETRIYALEAVMRHSPLEVRAYDRECLATLDGVRDALRELNLVLLGTDLEAWVGTESHMMAYLSATYVWCGDVVDDLEQLAEHGASGSWEDQTRAVAESATAYVTEFLAPLFRRLHEPNGSLCASGPLHDVGVHIDRLQSEIVSLSWELSPELSSDAGESSDADSR